MTDHDKKLREIIISKLPKMAAAMQEDNTDYMVKGADEAVTEIKQAFADEGYIRIEKYSGGGIAVNDGEVLMTGQEWYDRFITEFQALEGNWKVTLLPRMNAVKAAKKAAGLE